MPYEYKTKRIRATEMKGGDKVIAITGGSFTYRRKEPHNMNGSQRLVPIFDDFNAGTEVVVERYEEVEWGPLDPNYMATKFDSEICERLYYDYCMESGEECGDVDYTGHFTKLYVDEDMLKSVRCPDDFFGVIKPVGAIVKADDRGFIGFEFFFTDVQFDIEWEQLEEWVNSQYDDEGEWIEP